MRYLSTKAHLATASDGLSSSTEEILYDSVTERGDPGKAPRHFLSCVVLWPPRKLIVPGKVYSG